jgi:hypothetical protein
LDVLLLPLKGDSKLVSCCLDADVESARMGRAATELRGAARSRVREVCAREAIVGEELCVFN